MLDSENGLKAGPVTGVRRNAIFAMLAVSWLATTAVAAPATVTVTVKAPTVNGASISTGFRWVLEEDTTYVVTPGVKNPESLAVNLHKSYMPVVGSGRVNAPGSAVTLCTIAGAGCASVVPGLDSTKRYLISVLPNQGTDAAPLDCQASGNCFTQSGKQVTFAPGATTASVTVVVTPQPVPTAQAFVRAFEDAAPIDGVWEDTETPLENFTVFIYDMGGQMSTDTYGNPLGTVYEGFNSDHTPRVKRLGDGTIHTMSQAEVNDPNKNPYGLEVGEALIKNIAPGKYGVQIVPPAGQGWKQTSTIEGTPGLDVWVKAGEPRYFAEFGPAGHHAEFGFVKAGGRANGFGFPSLSTLPAPDGRGTIQGRVVNLHMSRPPEYTFHAGHPLPGCWVGLNDSTGTQGLYVARCTDDSTFTISGVPAGNYQMVFFDDYLDTIWNTIQISVQNGQVTHAGGGTEDDVMVFRWYQSHEHWVFNDLNENGERDAGEAGIPDQVINLRYRDGSIYQSSTTDTTGYLPMDEVFPFFSWLVAEVDFARFKATGVTIATDAGGQIDRSSTQDGAVWPRTSVGHGHLNPQYQDPADGGTNCDSSGHCLTRTEVSSPGPVLLEGYNAFIGTTTTFEWGKKAYGPGENGGITGVVHYTTTRAENDPRFATAENWEPGIPRVQVNLYRSDALGAIQDTNGEAGIQLADVDNYPRCWNPDNETRDTFAQECPGGLSALPGPEDLNRTGGSGFDVGDALEVSYTDSFDDAPPTGCPAGNGGATYPIVGGPTNDPFYLDGKCYDGLRNFAQVRPAVFDGGYAFGYPFTDLHLTSGNYVVEANTPTGYLHQREQDKNVDFGDAMTLAPQALPPVCVGELHHVPDSGGLLFPGVDSRYAGQDRPLCDRKVVLVSDGKNAAADFFMFTEVPVAGHIQGFVLNDLSNEFDPLSPNFGEKAAPSFIPVSVRDYAGNEVYHTYTDQWGTYNAIVPSAYRINTPMPSGVSPNILQVCLNSPVMEDAAHAGRFIPDPYFNKQFSQFCYQLDFKPGQTTYLDTPVLPIAAFVGPGNNQLDCELPPATPVVHSASVDGNTVGGGPFVLINSTPATTPVSQRTLILTSEGTAQVPDPNALRVDGSMGTLIARDFGFGATPGSVLLNGSALGTAGTPAAGWSVSGWTNATITVVAPVSATLGSFQLDVRRSVPDGGRKSERGITVTIGNVASRVHPVAPGTSIQAQIDSPATRPGDIVMVSPGTYQEMLIVTKPIQLQGWGAGATIINPVQSPADKITNWRVKVNYLTNCSHEIGLLAGQGNNTASASAPCGFVPGSGLFLNEEGPGVLVAPRAGQFNGTPARIDGLTITGADQSAGIVVSGNAKFLDIGNNLLANNQGLYAAGIRVGYPALLDADDVPVDADNDNLNIHNNQVVENGGLSESEPGAGIGIYTGSENYRVSSNFVCGNFATGDGAGIAHYGRSDGGVIADNKILFNQSFDQTVGGGGSGGGVLVAGFTATAGLTSGAGSVKVLRNIIQGNNAGSGNGGGISLRFVNGAEVLASNNTANWYSVDILNNLIVNNVAGVAAGAIALQDTLRASIVNNTIANNDSTATAADAFGGCPQAASPNRSCPQPAGIVAFANSAALNGAKTGRPASVVAAIGTYSRPTLLNDIIVGNRSKYWSVTGAVGETPGALIDSGFSDLAVVGVPGTLAPTYSILTAGAAAAPSPTNQFITLSLGAYPVEELAIFVGTPTNPGPYQNRAPALGQVQPDGTVTSDVPTPVQAFAATDEGGNFLDVHYGPLTLAGDYHLHAAPNIAVNTGATPSQYPNRSPDFEGQFRPTGASAATAAFDIGADELPGVSGSGSNQAPSILEPGILQSFAAYRGQPFLFAVVAADPNGDRLSYSMGGGLAGNLPLASGLQINALTGIVSWTPPASGPGILNGCVSLLGLTTCSVRVSVSDGAGGSDSRTFIIAVINAGAPTANADTITVNRSGVFTVGAPGVLANDTNPAGAGTLTAQLVSNLTAGGTVGLEANGTLTYTPDPSFVGTATFQYSAVNNAGSSAPVTSTLVRNITVTDAHFVNNQWVIEGVSATPGGTLAFRRSRNANSCTSNTNCPLLANAGDAGVTWDGNRFSFVSTNNVTWQNGDTVRVLSSFTSTASASTLLIAVPVTSLTAANAPNSTAFVQCPGDNNGDAVIDVPDPAHPRAVCKHLAAGDGFSRMADGTELYTFGFNDVTGVPANLAIDKGILNAHFPAPTLKFKEGDEVYLTLTNVGMLKRPDLFDPHSVHFHGFPNAGSVFDGVPESSIAINMGFSLTYYYNIVEPGTFMYHCHVEAAEHMQMGMLGNLYVEPAQNGTPKSFGGKTYTNFVYNDGNGSTGYDTGTVNGVANQPLEFPIQIGSMDSNFHIEHIGVQPLPFAEMHDDYPMLNGRGYPDTIDASAAAMTPVSDSEKATSGVTSANEPSQVVHTRIQAQTGKRILLRISNLNVTRFYTLATTGLRMRVVGTGAHILRGPGGADLAYETSSVTLGGGESADVLIDTTGVAPGTYLLYSTNLESLSNAGEDLGGMMTEIIITP